MSRVLDQEVVTAEHGVGVIATAVSLIERHAGGRQPMPSLSAAARTRLVAHRWGRDLEGLEACLQRALMLCDGGAIQPHHLALGPAVTPANKQQDESRAIQTLRAEQERGQAVAMRLGIAPRNISREADKQHGASEYESIALESAS